MNSKINEYEEIIQNAYPYNIINSSVALFTAGVAFIAGFSLLISIVKTKSEKWKIDMKLCFLLLCADLTLAAFVLINAAMNLAHYNNYLGSDALCSLNGVLISLAVAADVSLMGVISLERCLIIIFKKDYSFKFYFSILLFFCILNISNEIQLTINNGFKIYPMALYCFFDTANTSGLIGSILIVISGVISYTLIVICYLAICFYRRYQSQKAQLELGLDPDKVRKEVNSTIIRSLLIILSSILATGVYVIFIIISWFNPSVLTPASDMIQSILVESQVILNMLVLLNMRPELWRDLKALYGLNS